MNEAKSKAAWTNMPEIELNKAFLLFPSEFSPCTDFSIFHPVTEIHNAKLSRLLNLFTGWWGICNSIILMNSFSAGQPAGCIHTVVSFTKQNTLYLCSAIDSV